MNGDAEGEAPRPRPLSAGIWTLFSWLRRADRSSSSESVSSVGSDRTAASFDFLAPLHYQHADAPLVLPQGPLTDTYKHRLHERNLRRQHDRDLTLRRKYGLFREEGLGYDAFSLPPTKRLQKDTFPRQDRDRRATSEIQRRSAYVPGKRRAPLPPTVVNSATLPRNYKRKRPAPKPPVTISEENKENVEIIQTLQMNPASDVSKHSLLGKELTATNKTEKQNTKEVKLRTDKGFLKQIFDGKKRNSALDTSRVKLLPSISELDKQAAEIIEANKALRASGHSDSNFSSEDTWMCTTCLRKYKPVVTCCIYCMIKESSNGSKNASSHTSHICTQTDENTLKSNENSGIDDKKKLREMLKEMKDSLPKRPKHNDQGENRDRIIKPTETPTLRIGSTIDETIKGSYKNTKVFEKKQRPDELKNSAKEILVKTQPSSSKDISNNVADTIRQPTFEISSLNSNITGDSFQKASNTKALEVSVKEITNSSNKNLTLNKLEYHSANKIKQFENILKGDVKMTNIIHRPPDLGDTNERKSPSLHNGTNNVQLNVNKADHKLLKEHKDMYTIDPLSNPIETEYTENPANVKNLKTSVNNNKQSTILPIKKYDSACSGAKDKIERINLGNVISSNVENINQTELKTSSNSEKINLHKPLKISSLLNPLYCPKNASNDKVSDCNFGKVFTAKAANVENNKMDKSPIDQRKVLPKVTVSQSVNINTASKLNSEPYTEALQKSEARHTESLKIKNASASIEENPKRKLDENCSSEVKNSPTPVVKIFNHHDRRRNLINQLEQAISKGDEQLAAEAAAKLAKLKLACSVLSFSSQIVADPIPVKVEALQDNTKSKEIKTQELTNPDSLSNKNDESVVPKDKALIDKNQKEPIRETHNAINILPVATATTSSQILISEDEIPIEMWVEDKVAVRGPIPLRISRKVKLRELKLHVERSLGLEIRFQRWIVGRTLCTDDNTPLVALAGPDLNAPFFLCLVESETNKDNSAEIKNERQTQNKTQPNEINNAASGDVYTELMKLEQQALVLNTEEFECGVCIERCAAGAGAVLRECIHTFCRECLADVIRHCEEPAVACPAIQCPGALQEREIRAILSPEEYERWLARGLAAAESGTRNTFHCRTRDCNGWAFCEPGVRRFPCPVCKHTNCVPCQAVHEGETCEQYQVKLREVVSAAESNQTDEGTQALLKSLISRGEALECPECSAVITKKWGCDWVKCSACKTEICWVTRGRRWGPSGKGDTSGGCKCGIDGKRCHPSCGYCH